MMISVTIIAKNEAENIRRCLESVKWADEIIVLDSGSTDDTVAIAKEYTENVYSTDWQGYGLQKQRALERASGTWVLNLDADEAVSDELRQAIALAITKDEADAYRIPILLNFYGKPLKHSWSPKRHIRLYKREGARYTDNIIHEEVLVPAIARIGKLKQPLLHYSFKDFSHALYKMNTYSSSSAKMRMSKNRRTSFLKTLFGSWWMFMRCYFIQGGFLEGRHGFLLAVLSAEGSLYRGVKILYRDRESE